MKKTNGVLKSAGSSIEQWEQVSSRSQNVLKMKGDEQLQWNDLRLALDIGTNSIGWVLYDLNRDKKPYGIKGIGVRIFSEGRDPKEKTTLNAGRREARLQRRQRDRYLQRRKYLLDLLTQYGLFPKDIFSQKKLEGLNPYELRARGLDEKLDLYHFGRALFHLNQRRGFKSSRKLHNKKEDGVIKRSIEESKDSMEKGGARTYGEWLYKRFQRMEKSRRTSGRGGSQQENWILSRRPLGCREKDNYLVYAQRAMIEDEFNKLWEAQSRFHKELKDEKIKEHFHNAIFSQRNLKKPVVGKCYHIPKEDRISKALPSFQRFRILKELNNLNYVDNQGRSHPIVQMDRGIVFRNHVMDKFFYKKKMVKFSILEKEFKKFFPEMADSFSSFNLDSSVRDDLEGEQTYTELSKRVPDWGDFPLDVQDRFIEILEGGAFTEGEALTKGKAEDPFMKSDEEILENLKSLSQDKSLNLSDQQIKDCLEAHLPEGHGKYSKTLIGKIMPYLERGELEHEAIASAGYHHSDRRYKGDLQKKLPRYQKILEEHCVPVKRSSDSFKGEEDLRISNPTVHIALNQLRLVVNDIIRVYGRPDQIVVELARDLPMGQKTKSKYVKSMNDNQKRNDRCAKELEAFGIKNNRENREQYKLWEDQEKKCLYSGQTIAQSEVFTGRCEVDHILPFSKTLDDSYSNKVLVFKEHNQCKGKQTPYEAFSDNKENWENIFKRVSELSGMRRKKWRFEKDALKQFEDESSFLERQLNDTRYISKCAHQYLECIYKKEEGKRVWTVNGPVTFIVRQILKIDEKNRDDHRHHAHDALMLGLMDRGLIKRVSDKAKKMEGQDGARLERLGRVLSEEDLLPQWPDFKREAREALSRLIVSHKRKTKREGQLHNDTAYGVSQEAHQKISKEEMNFSKPIDVVHYKPLLDINSKKVKNILSPEIRSEFLKRLEQKGEIDKEFLKEYHITTGVRRIRVKENVSVIPISDKKGRVYKFFKGDSNYAAEIFRKEKGQWDVRIVSTFEANQKDFKPIPSRSRLMKGDMLFFNKKFWILVGFDKTKRFTFAEHFEANVDARNRDKANPFKYTTKTAGTLQKLGPSRVDISPCGKVKLTPLSPVGDFKKSA